jgi:uncharacterized protein YydD (DUF2326 family)
MDNISSFQSKIKKVKNNLKGRGANLKGNLKKEKANLLAESENLETLEEYSLLTGDQHDRKGTIQFCLMQIFEGEEKFLEGNI